MYTDLSFASAAVLAATLFAARDCVADAADLVVSPGFPHTLPTDLQADLEILRVDLDAITLPHLGVESLLNDVAAEAERARGYFESFSSRHPNLVPVWPASIPEGWRIGAWMVADRMVRGDLPGLCRRRSAGALTVAAIA